MLQTKLARIGAIVAISGAGVLGASLFTWSQASSFNRVYYKTHQHEWTVSSPTESEDEIWSMRASCLRPYYDNAVTQARAKLQDHNSTKPETLGRSSEKPSIYRRELLAQEAIAAVAKARGGPITQEEANLAAEAARANDAFSTSDWFPRQINLQLLVRQWEAKAEKLQDIKLVRSEALDQLKNPYLAVSNQIQHAKTLKEKLDVAAKHRFMLVDFFRFGFSFDNE